MINVLIVDDSPTLRHLIRAILTSDPELNVVGEAQNGQEALEMVRQLEPDLVTMDIHMPKMDGYSAIQHIMAECPRPIIILTSTESDIRLGITFKGIESGALMVLGKPHGLPGSDHEANDLILAVKAMADVKVVRRRQIKKNARFLSRSQITRKSRVCDPEYKIVAIGTSTGGPPALRTILGALPATFSIPIVVVQHISKGFTVGLARWLNDIISLHVKVAEAGELLSAGTVYIAPEGCHLQINPYRYVALNHAEPLGGHRPSVTALFNSVARHFGSSAVGVLLTGMGRDGADGLYALKCGGAYTIAQDRDSSIVFGMPGAAIALGAVNDVLPLDAIGSRLSKLMRRAICDGQANGG